MDQEYDKSRPPEKSGGRLLSVIEKKTVEPVEQKIALVKKEGRAESKPKRLKKMKPPSKQEKVWQPHYQKTRR